MLEKVTPALLTFGEAENIGRVPPCLTWARDNAIVDGFNTDSTLDIVSQFPQTRVRQARRPMKFRRVQSRRLHRADAPLDADYVLPPAFVEEMRDIDPTSAVCGNRAAVQYCVGGKPLRGTLYPLVTVLLCKTAGRLHPVGRTHRLSLDRAVAAFHARLSYSDRKTAPAELAAQDRYMRMAAENLASARSTDLSWADRVRRVSALSVFAVFFRSHFVMLCGLGGRAGRMYALQWLLAETLLRRRRPERML